LIDYKELDKFLDSLTINEVQELFLKVDKFIKKYGIENVGVQTRFIYFKLLAKGGRNLIELSQSLPPEVKEKMYHLINAENDYSFSTLSQVIFEWLIDEGKFERLKKGRLLNGPKVLFVSPIKYPWGDSTLHSIGNRYAFFQQISEATAASYLDLYGIETVVVDLGLEKDPFETLKKAIDDRTLFVSFRINNPVNEADLDTIFMVYDYVTSNLPVDKRPYFVSGGVSARGNYRRILDLTPIQIIFRTYSETNLVDMIFSKKIFEKRPSVDLFSDIPNIYLKTEHGEINLTRYVSITSRSMRRFKIAMKSIDFSKLSYERYWGLMPDSAQVHPEDRYLLKRQINIFTTHGDCDVGCEFCPYTGYSTALKGLPAEELISLIKRAIEDHPQTEMINFIDGDFFFDRKERLKFIKMFGSDIGLDAYIQSTVFSVNREILQAIKDAGISVFLLGVETASERILRETGKLKDGQDPNEYFRMPFLAKEIGIPTVRTSWMLFYHSITLKELIDTIVMITSYLEAGIHAIVSAYVLPRRPARIMTEIDRLGKYEIASYDYSLPNGKSYPIELVILPKDPIVREVAEKTVPVIPDSNKRPKITPINEELNQILTEYKWEGPWPEQIEALALFRLTLKNILNMEIPETEREKATEALNYVDKVIHRFLTNE
jgi:hypothetical protein